MKKLYIFILSLIAVFIVVFLNKDADQNINIFSSFNIVQFINNLDSLTEKEFVVRVFNQYPSGDPLVFKEGTRFLLGRDIYLLKENCSIPGLNENGDPGYEDVVVMGEVDIKAIDNVLTIPGLTGTVYEKTTWAEVKTEKEEEKKESYVETKVSGVIKGDTIWDCEHSPYIIEGNILVPEGVVLIIEPGTEIVFAGRYSFIVEGDLIFSGKKKNTIKLYGAKNIL